MYVLGVGVRLFVQCSMIMASFLFLALFPMTWLGLLILSHAISRHPGPYHRPSRVYEDEQTAFVDSIDPR